jgi:phosphoribosyl 1,2-cyclic phosphodiesterase
MDEPRESSGPASDRASFDPETAYAPVPPGPGARLRVLASGSSGNCSVLVAGDGPSRRVWLIDAGLSPRRTRLLLDACALNIADVEAIILTHLDTDHWNPGWARPGAAEPPVWVHRRHENQARRLGVPNPSVFGGPFEPGDRTAARIDPILMSHDEQGVISFRFEFTAGGCLGFATDLGHPTPRFIAHMTEVDVLALESNYCPRLQLESDRPWVLKRRIMGGNGHLSNQQAAQAAAEIRPRAHLVLLHLSRECNTPQLAAAPHAGADYTLTISEQRRPTRWITVPAERRPTPPRPALAPQVIHVQQPLFEQAGKRA